MVCLAIVRMLEYSSVRKRSARRGFGKVGWCGCIYSEDLCFEAVHSIRKCYKGVSFL